MDARSEWYGSVGRVEENASKSVFSMEMQLFGESLSMFVLLKVENMLISGLFMAVVSLPSIMYGGELNNNGNQA
jgi:hypothetical protein